MTFFFAKRDSCPSFIIKANTGGGGIYCGFNVGGKIVNNVFSNNTASFFGGGAMSNDSPSLDLTNNIISLNQLVSAYGCGQQMFVSPPNQIVTGHNDAHHNLPPELVYLAYYGWEPNPAVGDVNVDPKFLAPDKGDYHLKDSSLCIN